VVPIASSPAAPAYPLRVGPTRRYLVDADGIPFLIHGDTPWSLFAALTREEAEQYLANRAAKGFNSLIVNLIEHKFNGPINRYGEPPFTIPGRFSTPNEAYFAHADWCIRKAGELGMQILLAPIYLGYTNATDDDGYYYEALAEGVEGCREWGRYVGRRYGGFDNILWLMGGDRNPGQALDHVDAIVEGIKEHDTRHLFTAHTHPECSPVIEYARGGWVDVNNTYTYEIVHQKLLADYRRQPIRPFFLIESSYEGEHNSSPVQIRRQAYWAILCGGCGQFLGNNPIWPFNHGWEAAMELEGSRSMVHLRALFTSRPWYNLVPDAQHHLVTGGLGEFRGLDYLSAAVTHDGGTAIAYMPTPRAITADLTRICGKAVRAWWFDPRTGAAQPAGEFAASGSQGFEPPADGDWVLVLDDAGRGYPPPGAGG
jgi:hypothetical protein